MEDILEIKNLCKQYPGFRLEDVSFALPKGTIMGFVGENGAGKTTTIKLILNLIARDSGQIKLFGQDNVKDERSIKEQVGVVFDEGYFYEGLKPKEIGNVMKGIFKSWDNALFRSYLERFGLPADKSIKDYSKGMRMKLSIATALSHHPRLLILDEATSGLDPIARNEILDIFLEFIQDEEHSILLSSHITSDIEKIADYVTFLHNGKIIFSKPKDQLTEMYGVLRCGKNEFDRVDRDDIVAWRSSAFGCEALVKDRFALRGKYSGMVLESTTIEDIMLFYIKGELV